MFMGEVIHVHLVPFNKSEASAVSSSQPLIFSQFYEKYLAPFLFVSQPIWNEICKYFQSNGNVTN